MFVMLPTLSFTATTGTAFVSALEVKATTGTALVSALEVKATTGTTPVVAPAVNGTTETASAGIAAANKPTTATATAPGEIPLQFYQIAIEAVVVEVNEEYSRQVGIQYTYSRNVDKRGVPDPAIVKGIDVNAPPRVPGVVVPQMNIIPGGFNFGEVARAAGVGFSLTGMDVSDGQVGVRLRALIEEGKAQIRSRPMAVTLNKQLVKIETVDKVPYQDVTFGSGGSSQMAIQFEPVGVKLHVMPDIKSLQEGVVELDLIKLEVSALGRFVNLGNVQRPVFLKSEANTKVAVHDHDTLIIGGFKIEQDMNRGQGVPFLRRIPVIGYAFSNESKSLQRRDILFYITPHILKPGVQPTLPPRFEHREAVADVLQIPPAEGP
jgi:type II secretory pathway component GspD/PulD (secretin)